MSKWLGQRSGKSKQETKQRVPSDSLRALVERAVTDAEQIVVSIKVKAQEEAEEEAARIIEQARQSAEEIRKGAEVAQEPTGKGALKTKKVRKQAEKEVEELVQPAKEVTISEPVEAITKELPKQPPREERPKKEEPVSTPLPLDTQALYEGEVELAIAVPVDPMAVSKLYNSLQGTAELKVLYTRGSWDKGTIITVSLDRPLPLIDIITKISGIEVTPALPQKDVSGRGMSGPRLGAKGKAVKRVDLTLKAK